MDWPGDDAPCLKKAQYYVTYILALQKFDAIIGVVILINSITIGWESQALIILEACPHFEHANKFLSADNDNVYLFFLNLSNTNISTSDLADIKPASGSPKNRNGDVHKAR